MNKIRTSVAPADPGRSDGLKCPPWPQFAHGPRGNDSGGCLRCRPGRRAGVGLARPVVAGDWGGIGECLAIGWDEIDLYEPTVDVYTCTGMLGTARRRARLYHR
jgi:hypothetical protein